MKYRLDMDILDFIFTLKKKKMSPFPTDERHLDDKKPMRIHYWILLKYSHLTFGVAFLYLAHLS